MTLLSLVFGGSHAAREQAIASATEPGIRSVAIIEGMPTGDASLQTLPDSFRPEIFRIASGCPCCSGNLTLRVTLNRALRQRPDRLYLSLSNAEHKTPLRDFLQQPQYRDWLQLGAEIDCS